MIDRRSPGIVRGRPRPDDRPARLSPLDMLGLGLLGVRTRPLRAVLSALGISISIATIVVVTGVPASSRLALAEDLSRLGTDVLQARPAPGNDETEPTLLPPESVDMVARIGPVTVASAVANTHAAVARSDRIDESDYSGLTVLAARADLPATINARMAGGHFLDAATERFPTVVLGAVAASRLGFDRLHPDDPPPQVYIGRTWFTVIGILQPVALAPDIDRAVLVGWAAARQYLQFDNRPTVIYLKAAESRIEAVRAVLPATIYPELPGMVEVDRPSDALAAKRTSDSALSSLTFALASIALLVGAIGVANTMVISVLERRREIGLRRALGASRGQIRGQFLTESVVLSGLGGLAGVTLGIAAVMAYAWYQGWPHVIPPAAVAGGLGGAVVVGVIAGVYPSIRAARLTPTEALAAS